MVNRLWTSYIFKYTKRGLLQYLMQLVKDMVMQDGYTLFGDLQLGRSNQSCPVRYSLISFDLNGREKEMDSAVPLANFICKTRWEDLPSEAIASTKQHILHTIATTLGGWSRPGCKTDI